MQQENIKKPREANYVNLTDNKLKDELKAMLVLPNKDIHLNYVLWYKKENPVEWGLTVKGFPDKKFGTQHVFKITWFADKNEEGVVVGLKPANHCENQTEAIIGEGFEKILNIYSKYKK